MKRQHKPWATHVQAYINALRYEILAIRLLARDGISIADGKRYRPIPERDALEPVMGELEKALDSLETVLGLNADGAVPEDELAARFALKVRLESMADELPLNLSPNKIGLSYGAVPPREADTLLRVLPRLQKLVRDAANLIEEKRQHP